MHRVRSWTIAAAFVAACTAVTFGQTQAQPSADDMEFARRAAEAGRKEVEHGKIAASKASNAQVKSFAQALVKDHTAANQQLMAIAKRKKIDLGQAQMGADTRAASGKGDRGSVQAPGDATTATKSGAKRTEKSGTTGTTGASGGVPTTGEAADRQRAQSTGQTEPWMSETGAAFDRGFIDAQVRAHEEAIALFEKQAANGTDAELKGFASKQLPGLRAHLKQAQDLQKKLGTATH